MSTAATTTLSSKGQVVIPEEIRDRLGLKAGDQFVVVADRDVVIFKTLTPPARSEFTALAAQARKQAKQSGLTRGALRNAVARARRAK
jgi:AbrB family looped-hinge helix DNA binding protein